jgi:DNA-binding NarL/FixJ family response regulator
LLAEHRPVLAVLAGSVGSEEMPRWVRELHRVRAQLPVLVIGHGADPLCVQRVLRAGALGFVSCADEATEVLLAVASVRSGHLHVSKAAAGCLLMDLVRGVPNQAKASLGMLSDREMEVFNLVGAGMGCKEIANKLNISVKTVETHKQRMREKLRLNTGSELNRMAASRVAGTRPGELVKVG